MAYPRNVEQSVRWRTGRNLSGERIPPFACCALAEMKEPGLGITAGLEDTLVDDDGQRVLNLYKPSEFHQDAQDATLLAFNGPQPIEPDDGTEDGHNRGRITTDFPSYVLVEPDVAVPGDDVGPVADQWYLIKVQRGAFRLLGQDPKLRFGQADTALDPLALALVMPSAIQRVDAPDILVVRNMGSSVLAGSVLQIGDSLDTPLDPRRLRYEGTHPGANPRQVAVLLADCDNGRDVPARVSGVCAALVNVTNVAHRRAYPVSGATVLQSGWAGPAEFLRAPDGTGEQLCAVRLYTPNTVSYWGVTSSVISAAVYASSSITPGTGTVSLWQNVSGNLVPASATIVVKSYAPVSIASGLLVRMASDDDWDLVIVGQYCQDGFA